jgi:hypothetical protein
VCGGGEEGGRDGCVLESCEGGKEEKGDIGREMGSNEMRDWMGSERTAVGGDCTRKSRERKRKEERKRMLVKRCSTGQNDPCFVVKIRKRSRA